MHFFMHCGFVQTDICGSGWCDNTEGYFKDWWHSAFRSSGAQPHTLYSELCSCHKPGVLLHKAAVAFEVWWPLFAAGFCNILSAKLYLFFCL